MKTTFAMPSRPTTYQISGFDRISFVGDVTNAVPQNENYRITELSFESDGIRANGYLMVLVTDERHHRLLDQQLRAVRGLVSLKQIY